MILAKLAKYTKINVLVHANLKTGSLQLSLNITGSKISRRMTSPKDKSFNKRTQKAAIKVKRRNEVEINVVSATSFSKREVAENCYVHSILSKKFTVCLRIVCRCRLKVLEWCYTNVSGVSDFADIFQLHGSVIVFENS